MTLKLKFTLVFYFNNVLQDLLVGRENSGAFRVVLGVCCLGWRGCYQGCRGCNQRCRGCNRGCNQGCRGCNQGCRDANGDATRDAGDATRDAGDATRDVQGMQPGVQQGMLRGCNQGCFMHPLHPSKDGMCSFKYKDTLI